MNLNEEYVMPVQQHCLPPTSVKVATALIDGKMINLAGQKMISENTYQFVPMIVRIRK